MKIHNIDVLVSSSWVLDDVEDDEEEARAVESDRTINVSFQGQEAQCNTK